MGFENYVLLVLRIKNCYSYQGVAFMICRFDNDLEYRLPLTNSTAWVILFFFSFLFDNRINRFLSIQPNCAGTVDTVIDPMTHRSRSILGQRSRSGLTFGGSSKPNSRDMEPLPFGVSRALTACHLPQTPAARLSPRPLTLFASCRVFTR